MKYVIVLSMFMMSGCGFSAMSEQMKKSQNMTSHQECDKTIEETPTDGGGKITKEHSHCRQWRK